MARKNQLDDEFFGDLHDQDCKSLAQINDTGDLEKAESSAVERQFHTLGFHEAYEETKDSLLQQGFEDGYRKNFEAAMRIGQLLGEFTAKSKLNPMQQARGEKDPRVARLIRAALTKPDDQGQLSLDQLEEQVLQCINECISD
jgi:hypothetical protein